MPMRGGKSEGGQYLTAFKAWTIKGIGLAKSALPMAWDLSATRRAPHG
jgi:hypothetical protein